MTDQFTQTSHDYIETHDKFHTLRLCQRDCETCYSKLLYFDVIKSLLVRKCFARLRLDKAF